MKDKQKKPDEYRMKASEFDKMMRRALGAPPFPADQKPSGGKRKRKATKK